MKKIIPFILALLLLAGCHTPTVPSSSATERNATQAAKPSAVTTPQITEPQLITEEEAKKLALEHAGLNEVAIKSFSIELDWADYKYEIEFFTKGIEYEYEIHAITGEILEADMDRD